MEVGWLKRVKRHVASILVFALLFTVWAPAPSFALEAGKIALPVTGETPSGLGWGSLEPVDPVNNIFSYLFRMSPDGRYVAYLHVGVQSMISVRDRTNGVTEDIAPAVEGLMIRNFNMSSDARFFAYAADDIIDNQRVYGIYVYDRTTGETDMLDIRQPDGDPARAYSPDISDGGRYVVFESDDKITADDSNFSTDVYLYDRTDGSVRRVSRSLDILMEADTDRSGPSISANGKYIVFESFADDLMEGDTNDASDIFVYDIDLGKLINRLHVSSGVGRWNSGNASISADGSVVAFESHDVSGDAPASGIFTARTDTGTVEFASAVTDETEPGVTYTYLSPQISADGKYVAYFQKAVPGYEFQLYVTDISKHQAVRVDLTDERYKEFRVNDDSIGIADQAQSIVFSASYTVDGENSFSNLWLAHRSSGPSWPQGGMLEAIETGTASVTLSWPEAIDPLGLKGYQLYRNGTPLFENDALFASNRFQVSGLLPDTEYTFHVEAVNTGNIASNDKLSLTVKTEKDNSSAYVSWSADRLGASGTLVPNSLLSIDAKGPSGSRTVAEVTYGTWLDVNGQLSDKMRIEKTEVTLTEAVSGSYKGLFPVTEGMKELISITLSLEDGSGNVLTASPEGWRPLSVSGGVRLTLNVPDHDRFKGLRLQARKTGGASAYAVVSGAGSHTLEGLPEAGDYQVTLRDRYGILLGSIGDVDIRSGLITPLSMDIPLPATLEVLVKDPENLPLPFIQVKVWDETGRYASDELVSDLNGRGQWSQSLLSGDSIHMEVDVGDALYHKPENQVVVLKPGHNEIEIVLSPLAEIRLTGIVTDPEGRPVTNALVTATQLNPYTGKQINKQVRTGLDGAYVLYLFEGETKIKAADTSRALSSDFITLQLAEEKVVTVDLPVKQPSGGLIELQVYLKRIGGTWEGPLDLSKNKPFSVVMIRSTHGYFFERYKDRNVLEYRGFPGEKVTVCVVPNLISLPQSCQTLSMDYSSNRTLEFRLEETGAWVRGTVPDNGERDVSALFYRFDPAKADYFLTTNPYEFFSGNTFELHVPSGGDYRLHLGRMNWATRESDRARVQFTVNDREIRTIGDVRLVREKPLVDPYFSFFSAAPARTVQGGTVHLRAEYRNSGDEAIADARLVVPLPEGLEPIRNGEGQIAVKGTDSIPAYENRMLEIPLGTIAKTESSHIVSVPIQVSSDFNQPSVQLSMMMKGSLGGETREETLGSVILEMPRVTLDVTEHVLSLDTVVSGTAPAGSTVEIYDTGAWIGSAKASPAGLWTAKVSLTDLGDPGIHLLQASAEVNGVTLHSPQAFLEYDTKGPQLQEAAISQLPDGRWMTFKPQNGTARFPYTVIPGHPFAVQLRFKEPEQVKNVRIYISGQEGPPVRAKLEGGLYRAVIPTSGTSLGSVYVSYDSVDNFDKESPEHNRTIEQIRKSLPPAMRDFEVESVTPFERKDGNYEGTAVIKLPQLKDARMTITLKVKPDSNYAPTTNELEAAQESGLPLFNPGYESTETDKSMTSVVSGVLPIDFILPTEEPYQQSQLTKNSPVMISASGWGDLAEFTMEVHTEVTDPLGNVQEVKDMMGDYMEYAEKINRIMYKASTPSDCIDQTVNSGKQAAKALLVTVGGEVAKVALDAWAGAMALEGPAGVAAGIIGDIVSNQIDNYVDQQIDAVGTGYNPCKDDEDEPYDPEVPSEDDTDKIADPDWIYDPSGYVYEAVTDNRLENVKSTVMYLDSATSRWRIWDAEPYGQTNPHETDGDGRYGWDVPPGKWKVVWEKEGYETAASRELDVPPPHTDVNAELVSFEPPVVDSVLAAASPGGSYVEMEFSKYLKTAEGLAGAVTLMNAGGTEIDGQAQFMDVEESTAGEPLSRKIRFTPESVLTAGQEYTIKVPSSRIMSYAGVPLEQDLNVRVTAVAKDEDGPIPTAVVFEGHSLIRVTFSEPLSADEVQPQKFEWMGRTDAIRSAVPYSAVPGGKMTDVLLTLAGPSAAPQAGLTLKVLAEAARDEAGNPSAEGTLTVTLPPDSLSMENRLNELTVSGGSIAPAFHPDITSYTVTVQTSVQDITLTGNPKDAKSKLFVQGLPASGGAAEKIRIPEDGVITVKVQAEDPNAVRWYTLTVIRSDNTQTPGGGVYIPPAPPTGDPQDIGGNAVIKSSTIGDQTKLDIIIQSATVERIVRVAEEGSVFFVKIEDAADEYAIRFPAQAFRLLSDKKGQLHLQAGAQMVKFRTDVFKIPEGAESVLVTIANDSSASGKSLLRKLNEMNPRFAPESDVFEAAFQVEFGGDRVEELDPSDPNAISLERDTDGALLFRFDPATGRWVYVPGNKDPETAQLQFPWHDGGLFAVWRYDGTFADTRNHWARRAIDWMAARLYVMGYDTDTFRPNRTVTRAEFAAMLVRILGVKASNAVSYSRFKDVPAESWYAEAVGAAVKAGLVEGVGGGLFKPGEIVTREQMTAMVWRAYEKYLKPGEASGNDQTLAAFKDEAEMSGWSRAAIAAALKAGLVHGVAADEFDPMGTATRAQAATILQRIAEQLEK